MLLLCMTPSLTEAYLLRCIICGDFYDRTLNPRIGPPRIGLVRLRPTLEFILLISPPEKHPPKHVTVLIESLLLLYRARTDTVAIS